MDNYAIYLTTANQITMITLSADRAFISNGRLLFEKNNSIIGSFNPDTTNYHISEPDEK